MIPRDQTIRHTPADVNLFAPRILVVLQTQSDADQLLQVGKAEEEQWPLDTTHPAAHTHTQVLNTMYVKRTRTWEYVSVQFKRSVFKTWTSSSLILYEPELCLCISCITFTRLLAKLLASVASGLMLLLESMLLLPSSSAHNFPHRDHALTSFIWWQH